MAAAKSDKLSRAGLAGPVRFVGITDTAIDEDSGNFIECPKGGTCALCGESLRYVVHFIDANGRAFAAGSNCAKWAQLSKDERSIVRRRVSKLAKIAKIEKKQPGWIRVQVLEKKNADDSATRRIAQLRAEPGSATNGRIRANIADLEMRIARSWVDCC